MMLTKVFFVALALTATALASDDVEVEKAEIVPLAEAINEPEVCFEPCTHIILVLHNNRRRRQVDARVCCASYHFT